MAQCNATYTERVRHRRVRLTNDEPWSEEWDSHYACEREAGHGGDHHGPVINQRADQPSTVMTWPVVSVRLVLSTNETIDVLWKDEAVPVPGGSTVVGYSINGGDTQPLDDGPVRFDNDGAFTLLMK